ncbi:hypothetical protein HELRODRAFT_180301 [Helobdella robusta]|uniref:Uncharacterized protein n=1 Tax=Helobdella robusta TaxID=6412 RepID=T1FFQ0_HELRO|nr:hypothetical protein HELRODRAFT_180301 [Helobdella robusta]ESN94131.1 hypothetical protein HELRODRAFT_180301 [Helobdella robusta]
MRMLRNIFIARRLLSSMSTKIVNDPVIVILGSTGVGKSQLAVEVAKEFDGEVVNADAMQIYKGLDIVTNKISVTDQLSVPHHLLDCICPYTSNYNVLSYKNAATQIISDVHARNKVPVIVGGTNYYIEALLWDFVLPQVTKKSSPTEKVLDNLVDDYERLKQIDLESALQIHPNDTRKVKRALEVFEDTGETKSSLLKKQKLQHFIQQNQQQQPQEKMSYDKMLSGPLKYKNICMIWLQCDQNVLDERINKRVDSMLKMGLIKELLAFHKKYLSANKSPDYKRGLFQSIGLKEFHDYLVKVNSDMFKSGEDHKSLQTALEKGIADMKLATRSFYFSGIFTEFFLELIFKHILDRGLDSEMEMTSSSPSSSSPSTTSPASAVPLLYGLHSTNVEQWHDAVKKPAFQIIHNFLTHQPITQPPLSLVTKYNPSLYNVCEECKKIFVKLIDWKCHMSSRRHKKTVQRNKRLKNENLGDNTISESTLSSSSSSSRSSDDEAKTQNYKTISMKNELDRQKMI